jgi:hypothetical protein
MNGRATLLIATMSGLTPLIVGSASLAESTQRLSGKQIRASFTGMQLTDEVHYRFVCGRDGTLRSYAMGVKKQGKWVVSGDQLCLYLQEPDDGCYDVSRSGDFFTLTPAGLGLTLTGIIERVSDRE